MFVKIRIAFFPRDFRIVRCKFPAVIFTHLTRKQITIQTFSLIRDMSKRKIVFIFRSYIPGVRGEVDQKMADKKGKK